MHLYHYTMKYICSIILVLLLSSCSTSDKNRIKTVENAIQTPILHYKTVDYKDSGSIGYPVKVIDVTFSEADFNTIVKKIDLKGFTKENGDYFKDFVSDSIKWHIAVFSRENKIRYAELD